MFLTVRLAAIIQPLVAERGCFQQENGCWEFGWKAESVKGFVPIDILCNHQYNQSGNRGLGRGS